MRRRLPATCRRARRSDAIANARTAALLDPEGEALTKCLAALASPPAHAIAAE